MKKQNDAAKRKMQKEAVSPPAKVTIHKLPTGVRGLDDILGGGVPEFSFNVIAGMPGCGKTTMAHQLIFANATVKKPALYFTVLGEPALKMLRYQQQFSFFDESKLGKAIRFINLSDLVLNQDLNAVLAEIIEQVTAVNPGIVVVVAELLGLLVAFIGEKLTLQIVSDVWPKLPLTDLNFVGR